MGTNALGQKTVPVIANRRLSYYGQVAVPGERFECDEVQAKAWEKTGAATIVQERPKFKPEPVVTVDPVVAKVLEAENPNPTAHHEPPAESSHVESMSTDNEAPQQAEVVAAQQPAVPVRGRYDRRDMRSKP